MNLRDVERLVAELLATGQMNRDTQEDLYRILAEAKSSRSYADDLRYLQDLHARILPAAGSGKSGSSRKEEGGEAPADLHAQILKLRGDLDRANRMIAELERRQASGGGDSNEKFREIKKRFAKRYHPNALGTGGIDALVRAEIFKEFWADIEEVERS